MEKIVINIGDPNNAILDDTENCIVFRVANDLEKDGIVSRITNEMNTETDGMIADDTVTVADDAIPSNSHISYNRDTNIHYSSDCTDRYVRIIPEINTYTDK